MTIQHCTTAQCQDCTTQVGSVLYCNEVVSQRLLEEIYYQDCTTQAGVIVHFCCLVLLWGGVVTVGGVVEVFGFAAVGVWIFFESLLVSKSVEISRISYIWLISTASVLTVRLICL
ncbi:hypothetical protein A2U01_0032871, partial [Trifolium medium]|nr:hypothetical protein [Trifolium medium]